MKRYSILFSILTFLVFSTVFFVVTNDIYAASGSKSLNGDCRKQGSATNCPFNVNIPDGGQAYRGQINGMIWGYGGFGGSSGGDANINGCLNRTFRMWDGACWNFYRGQVFDASTSFSDTNDLDTDIDSAYYVFVTDWWIDDGRINADYTVWTRMVEFKSFSVPPNTTQGVPFTVDWDVEHGARMKLTYSGAGMSCAVSSGGGVNARGSTSCTAGSSGRATFILDYEGPSSSGSIADYAFRATQVSGSSATTGPGLVPLDFNVSDACTGGPVAGASVNIDPQQDAGNGTNRTTDGNGFANIGVNKNQSIPWTVFHSSFNISSGYANSGPNGTTVGVALNRSCSGPPSPSVPQCSDGVDNDGDGRIDLADPGCSSSNDNDETDSGTSPPPPPPPPVPQPTPEPNECIDGSLLRHGDAPWGETDLPDTMTPGEKITFEVKARNTVNETSTTNASWWYKNGYRLQDLSCLTIYPEILIDDEDEEDRILSGADAGKPTCGGGVAPPSYDDIKNTEYYFPRFTLVAPLTPGSYTLQMKMVHNSGWAHERGGDVCGPTPASDFDFGQTLEHTFTVEAPPSPEADITCDNKKESCSIDYNDSATIEWCGKSSKTCANANSCKVTMNNGTTVIWSGKSGEKSTGDLTSDTIYTLTCEKDGISISDSVTVEVGDAPGVEADIRCDNKKGSCSVGYGSTAKIKWCGSGGDKCKNANFCVTSGSGSGSGNPPNNCSGEWTTPALTSKTTYTLTNTRFWPFSVVSDSVTVNVGGPPLPEADIRCNDKDGSCSIGYNKSATIEWCGSSAKACSNASSCSVSPSSWSGLSGTQSTGNLTTSKTYTLNCSGLGGKSSDSVTVNVASAPALPDLDVIFGPVPSISGVIYVNDTLTFSATTQNIGAGVAPNSKIKFKVVNGPGVSDFTISDYHDMGVLGPGKSVVNTSASWTPTVAGVYNIQAIADWRGDVSESNENNNNSASSITVINRPECSDGLDNDGDGKTDYPADPGCTSPTDPSETDPECSDGLDNDSDTWSDANDIGCWTNQSDSSTYNPLDNDESNAPGNQCSDGKDNDGDGLIDSNDPNCIGPTDDSEANPGFEEF